MSLAYAGNETTFDAGIGSGFYFILTPYVQEGGDNALGLRVVDSLTNRMIGDASLPQEERYTYAYPEIVKVGDRLVSLGRYR